MSDEQATKQGPVTIILIRGTGAVWCLESTDEVASRVAASDYGFIGVTWDQRLNHVIGKPDWDGVSEPIQRGFVRGSDVAAIGLA